MLCHTNNRQGWSVTRIGLPETRLGIIPGAGGTQRAVRLLGLSKAKELIYTAKMLTALEAKEYGVVNYVSKEGTSAVDGALTLAKQIASNGSYSGIVHFLLLYLPLHE